MDFDIEKYQKEMSNDYKIIYDVFCAYFLNMMEGPKKEQYLSTLNDVQLGQITKWISEHIIPFYESLEDYEKCSRLKTVKEFIESKRN
jgi:hypothetical protein